MIQVSKRRKELFVGEMREGKRHGRSTMYQIGVLSVDAWLKSKDPGFDQICKDGLIDSESQGSV